VKNGIENNGEKWGRTSITPPNNYKITLKKP
jgi:hypothetical protein